MNRDEILKALADPIIFIKVVFDIDLDEYQKAFVLKVEENYKKNINTSLNDIVAETYVVNKSRQVGFTFVLQLLSIYYALIDDVNVIYISYRWDEVMQKIVEYLDLIKHIDSPFKPIIKEANKKKIVFEDEQGFIKSQFFGFSSNSEIRGIPTNKRTIVIADESAYFGDGVNLEASILPLFSRCKNGSFICYCSTPFIADKENNLFYRKYTDNRAKIYKMHICWYDFALNLKDENPIEIGRIARELKKKNQYIVKDFIYKYGSKKIKSIFEKMDLESFLREYEGVFIKDKDDSFFNMQLIKPSINYNISYLNDYEINENEEFEEYYAGIDIGATNDESCLFVLGLNKKGKMQTIYKKVMQNIDLTEQMQTYEEFIENNYDKLKLLYVEQNGIGMQIAQYLEKKFKGKCKAIHLDNKFKNEMVYEVKKALEKENVFELVNDKDLLNDFLKIKKEVNAKTNVVKFTATRIGTKHADSFIAFAYANKAFVDCSKNEEVDGGFDFINIEFH